MPERDRFAKEACCEELSDWAKANGQLPDSRAIEEQVHSDIALCVAREREAKMRPEPPAKPERATDVEAEAAKRELTLLRDDDYDPVDKPRLPSPKKTARTLSLEMRIRALLHFNVTEREFSFPAFAKEIRIQQMRAAFGVGDYKGLSRWDKNRQITARLESICDRSDMMVGFSWRGMT